MLMTGQVSVKQARYNADEVLNVAAEDERRSVEKL